MTLEERKIAIRRLFGFKNYQLFPSVIKIGPQILFNLKVCKFFSINHRTSDGKRYIGWITHEDTLELVDKEVKKKILFNLDLFYPHEKLYCN